MRLSDYQRLAARTSRGSEVTDLRMAVACMGLAGESGELIDLLKKHIGHGHPLDRDKVKDELGDILWYAAEIATIFGLQLDDVALHNVSKLARRYPQGFSTEASINRKE